jgi:hypothetical protein
MVCRLIRVPCCEKIQELEEKLLETQLQLERVTDERLVSGMQLLPLTLPLPPRLFLLSLLSQILLLLKIKGRTSLMEMFRALRSPLPSEDLLYAITIV